MESRVPRRTGVAYKPPEKTERKPYQRRRQLPNQKQKRRNGLKEFLGIQIIVSSLLIVFTLFLTVINSENTNSMRSNLKTALSDNITVEEVQGFYEDVKEQAGYLTQSVTTIFGNQEDDQKDAPDNTLDDSNTNTHTDTGANKLDSSKDNANSTTPDILSSADGSGTSDLKDSENMQIEKSSTTQEDASIKIDEDLMKEINSKAGTIQKN